MIVNIKKIVIIIKPNVNIIVGNVYNAIINLLKDKNITIDKHIKEVGMIVVDYPINSNNSEFVLEIKNILSNFIDVIDIVPVEETCSHKKVIYSGDYSKLVENNQIKKAYNFICIDCGILGISFYLENNKINKKMFQIVYEHYSKLI